MSKVALIDLDGTLADYDASMTKWQKALQAPCEEPYDHSMYITESVFSTRRKLIQLMPDFWYNLEPIQSGFEILKEIIDAGFSIHILSKGPKSSPNAWTEKFKWCNKFVPTAKITIGEQKDLVYGRVLFDDFPPYFEEWLKVRKNGLVICLPHIWNEAYKKGGTLEHPNVIRYDGSNIEEIKQRLKLAFER